MKTKQYTIENKSVDDSEREITFIVSTEDVDRDKDILKVDGWITKDFMKNPVFLLFHNTGQFPVGKFSKIWADGKKLMGKATFADLGTNPNADIAFELYKQGIMNAVSVSFVPDKDFVEENKYGGLTFSKQTLMEISGVPVPANPKALAVIKEFGKDKNIEDFYSKDVETSTAEPDEAKTELDEAKDDEDVIERLKEIFVVSEEVKITNKLKNILKR